MIITLEANSPIAHGEFTDGVGTGNVTEFRKVPIVHNGKLIYVPTISGNAIRGVIRRNLTREFFEINKLEEQLEKKEHDKLYAILGNGGALSTIIDTSYKGSYVRELRKKLPILSVLGGACYKYMIPGMCNVGFFKLKCSELGNAEKSIVDMIAEVGLTKLLDIQVIDCKEQNLKPMPYIIETICEGAEFEGEINFEPMATPIEKSCLYHGINSLSYVGGKNASGFGRVKVSETFDDSLYISKIQNIDIDFIKDFIRSIS